MSNPSRSAKDRWRLGIGQNSPRIEQRSQREQKLKNELAAVRSRQADYFFALSEPDRKEGVSHA